MCSSPLLISACLLGMRSRYDGGSRPDARMLELARRGPIIAFCPELLGGLSAPRPPAEIKGGDGRDVLDGRARVLRHDGTDVTEYYLWGAEAAAEIVKRYGVVRAYLKERSPACGVGTIKRGADTISGMGVCAALLARMGVAVVSV